MPATCRIGTALTRLHGPDIACETFDTDFRIRSVCGNDRYTPRDAMELVAANAWLIGRAAPG